MPGRCLRLSICAAKQKQVKTIRERCRLDCSKARSAVLFQVI